MTARKVPNYDFIGKFPIAFVFSAITLALSFYIFFAQGEAKYGVDFTGGHELLLRLESDKGSDGLRSALNTAGYTNAIVQEYEPGSSQYLVRLEGAQGDSSKIATALIGVAKNFGESSEILRQDFVGPTIGHELRRKAFWAVLLSLVGIAAYISFRFEFAFALGALVALFHDVIVATGVYLFAGQTFSMGAVAAALTIVGYSVNDTIVIFDRIREELAQATKYNLVDVMNRSVNAMLSRSLVTYALTLFSVLALYMYGGGAISDLSLYLLVGIVAGGYSTIYIACPVVLLWHRFRGGAIEG